MLRHPIKDIYASPFVLRFVWLVHPYCHFDTCRRSEAGLHLSCSEQYRIKPCLRRRHSSHRQCCGQAMRKWLNCTESSRQRWITSLVNIKWTTNLVKPKCFPSRPLSTTCSNLRIKIQRYNAETSSATFMGVQRLTHLKGKLYIERLTTYSG
jgi:hypothetical protein